MDEKSKQAIKAAIWSIRILIETYGYATIDRLLPSEVIRRLNNLQPQSQLKLSEEQIKVCKVVYADLLSAKGFDLGFINSELNRMEEQLKAL